jgi:hypothetical protein
MVLFLKRLGAIPYIFFVGIAAVVALAPEPGPVVMFSAQGYTSVADVIGHNQAPADIAEIETLLAVAEAGRPVDFAAIADIYAKGHYSIKRNGSVRSLHGFAVDEARFGRYFPEAVAYYEHPTFVDDFITSAIAGNGSFAAAPVEVRRQAINQGLVSLLDYWVRLKLMSAGEKAAEANFKPDDGAPSNWDEAFAVYYGPAGRHSLHALAAELSECFELAEPIDAVILAAFKIGQARLASRQNVDAEAAVITTQLNRVFLLALIRSGDDISTALRAGDRDQAQAAQARGWALYYTLAPTVAAIAPEADALLVDALAGTPTPVAGRITKRAVGSLLGELGLTTEDLGTALAAEDSKEVHPGFR